MLARMRQPKRNVLLGLVAELHCVLELALLVKHLELIVGFSLSDEVIVDPELFEQRSDVCCQIQPRTLR